MSNDRNINANLNLKPDTAQAETALNNLQKKVQGVERSITEMEKEARDAGRTIQRELGDKAQYEIAQTKKEADSAKQSLLNADEALRKQRIAAMPVTPGKGAPAGGTGPTLISGAVSGAGAFLGPQLGAAGGAVQGFSDVLRNLTPIAVGITAGTIALGIAMSEVNKKTEERKRIINAEIEIVKERAELYQSTTAQLQEERAEREKLLEVERQRQEDLQRFKTLIEDARDAQDGLAGATLDLQKALSMEPEIDAVNEALKETQKQVRVLEGGLGTIDRALSSAEVAANDAAAAFEELQEQMADDLLDAAEDAGKAVRDLEAAQSRTKEANLQRLDAINTERQAIEAELAVLEAQATESEEVTKRIEQLRESLSDLGAESEVVNRTIKEGSRADREVAQDAAKQRTKERQAEERERRKEANERAKKVREEARKAREEAIKAQIDFANKVADIEYKAAQDREKIAIDANREQERLIRESRQQFNQDFFQDFLGEFQRRQDLTFSLRETQIATSQALSDVGRESTQAQQQLRAESGAQPLLGPITNYNTFAGMGQAQTIQNMMQLGIIPSNG